MAELQTAILRQNQTVIDIPGYKIERTLGKGGMASVYLAIQESFEREVALKVMNPSLSEDSKFSERFLREAKIVSRLVHPNIVTVYDVGVHNQQHYLSMEYIPGEDLKHKRKKLTLKESLQVIRDVARALDYACKKGYVHRDVKPENIMLHEDDGRAVLMDFGIACLSDTASGMTQTGTAIGTPHYMSPEQAKGRAVDPRSDIYSLGVVLFLLVTGHVPFDADSAVAVGIKHVSAEVPRLAKCYALLQPIIDKVMAKEPSDRYQNGADLIEAIEQITDDDIKAIELLSTRSFAAVPDDKSDITPTVLSQSQAAVKQPFKNNPNLTTVSGTALNTKATSTIKSQSSVSKTVTNGQAGVTSGQTAAVTGSQPKTTTAGQRVVSAKTPTNGTNKVVKASNGKESPNTGSRLRGSLTNSQTVSKVSGSQKSVVQKSKSQQSKNQTLIARRTGSQSAVSTKSGAQRAALQKTGSQPKLNSKNGNYNANESLFVDEEDRREHNVEPHKRSVWPWAIAASLLLVSAGSLYFRQYFPAAISQPLDTVVDVGINTKNDLFVNLGWSTPPTNMDNSIPASVDNAASTNNALTIADPVVTNTPAANAEDPLAVVDSEANADKDDQGVMGKARSLREELKNDLSVAPQLAQLYRDILRESPDMKNAEWGLRDVREYHDRFIRDSFQVRDLETTQRYMASLAASFPGEMESDEKYVSMLARIKQAEQAQVHIDKAASYLANDALSSPKDANAVESYQQALAIDAGNPIALAGMDKIVNRYVELGRESFDKGNLNDALQSASRGLALNSSNAELLKLREDTSQLLERSSKTNALLLAAREQLNQGNLVEPKGDSAYDRYKELLNFDRGNDEAEAGLREVEKQLAFKVEAFINRNQFDLAGDLIDRTSELFSNSEKMEVLKLSLATAKEADFIARQPKIPQLLVSNKVPSSIEQAQEPTLKVERTIHIGFSYANFINETSVVQVVLYDGSRTVQIAQVPVVVSGRDGVKFFQIDRPVEGFSEGGYNIDLILGDNKLRSSTFKVANN